MKTLWNILAVLAVFNLLAVGGLVAWLRFSDRLNIERASVAYKAIGKTITQENAEKAAAADEAKRKEAETALAAKLAQPPTSAAEKIAERQLKDDQDLQLRLRRQQEIANLAAMLTSQMARMDERERKLDTDRKAFAAERKRVLETDGERQFQLALSTLEGQKAKDAKEVLSALLQQKQADQVVAYLAKMDDGKRAKVIAEFVKDNAAVAADLLERLRTRGVIVPAQSPSTQVSADDASSSTAVAGSAGGAGR